LQLLHPSECNLLLKYFSEAIEHHQIQTQIEGSVQAVSQSENCRNILRRLPFYISLSGTQTELADYDVYILPQGIPSAEIDVWRSECRVLHYTVFRAH